MAAPSLSAREIDFTYPSAPDPIIKNLSATFPTGFTGVVGANGAGKTTLLQLLTGELTPDNGVIDAPGDALYCAQRTDDPPPDFGAMLDDTGAPVYALRHRLGIEWDWLERWQTLSHGERKRAQIGCALWRGPSILAIDEPTNHLDVDARRQLIEALREFDGIGLLVSHDRALLDELCSQCLWLSKTESRVYPGGYTDMVAIRENDATTAERTREKARKTLKAVKRDEQIRREHLQKAVRLRSKRGIDPKDHSAKAAVNGRINTDSKEGQRFRQLDGHMERAEKALENARVEKTYRTGIEMPGVVCRRDYLLRVTQGEIPLGEHRKLAFPDLLMKPSDRIALKGANGLGKSTLLRYLIDNLNVEPERVVIMPQEITADDGTRILEDVKSLPKDELGHAMNVVSCLGSRPGQLLDSHRPSPGELRKLLLAVGMTRKPYLLIMDEPTNHLDLPSIEALEAALADCSCGMLLVSHDEQFLESLTTTSWTITQSGNNSLLTLT